VTGPLTEADRHYAAGLATALLSGGWDRAELRRNCARALGRQRPPAWVGTLIDQLRSRVSAPPSDAPRTLAALLPTLPAWTAGRVSRTRIPIVAWRPVPTTMGERRWPVRVVDDVSELARLLDVSLDELAWFADVRSLERSVASPLRHYRVQVRRQAGGSVRVLEAPKPRLREMQRRLLRHLVAPVPVHPAAHGCVPGRSVRTALAPHAGHGAVLRCDLAGFFASIAAGRIWGVLRMTGLPEAVAHTVTGLTTTTLATEVWREIEPPGDADAAARHRALGRALATPHLPQGAPTSPGLANLVAFNLDRRLSGLAAALELTYTRYVDDLIFSGPGLRAGKLFAAIDRIVVDEGFRVARHKNVVLAPSGRQQLLGGVVNVKTSVPRRDRDRLRAILHNCAVHGWSSQARGADREQFRHRLEGRVAWVNALDPRRGAQLRAMLTAVDWTPVHAVPGGP
jgi:RNA-directed DNA polymerase